ncbi:hypothetical protein EII22_08890 [Coriobacteriales bacterium OH1046]|nr:hypothetical protein EII22_08890 [Coriobacteriales bacterium OH1046]
MSTRTTVYEDNAGGINVYHKVDGETVWAAHYYMMEHDGLTAPELAAQDFVALTIQGLDPIEEGWEYGEADSLLDIDDEMGSLIADSNLYHGRAEDMILDPAYFGLAGRKFHEAVVL